MPTNPKMFRTPIEDGSKRSTMFSIRISEEERKLFYSAAAKEGIAASYWARKILHAAAEEQDTKSSSSEFPYNHLNVLGINKLNPYIPTDQGKDKDND